MSTNNELKWVLSILRKSDIPREDCDIDKFHVIFRRLVQEHVADRIFARSASASSYDEAVNIGLQTAREWFGPRRENDWPIDREWLKEYIKGRYHGSRSGIYIEDKPGGGKNRFIENNPKSSATCEWILGCNQSDGLEIDHVTPTSLHGKHSPENYQYLCENHNRRWKGNLLFWDVEMPLPSTRD